VNLVLGVPDATGPLITRRRCAVSDQELHGENTLMIRTDCGLGGRVHPQIAWAKLRALRDDTAIASKKLWS
jgi:methionine synthase II (cobalamin-independent)